MDAASPVTSPLVRKLESIVDLSTEERFALAGVAATVRNVAADHDIVRDGDRPSECCLILDGFACRYKLTRSGRRQIFSFHVAGDIPDLQSLHLGTMDHSLGTLTPSRVALIPHETMRDLAARFPRLAAAWWRDTLIEAATFREWMMGLGRREAYGRMAHLLCELFVRLQAVGLADGHSYALPVTQAELGDALGLSTVHVNRTLQELRRDGLIVTRGAKVAVLDWEGLKAAGEFDPAYLRLRKEIG